MKYELLKLRPPESSDFPHSPMHPKSSKSNDGRHFGNFTVILLRPLMHYVHNTTKTLMMMLMMK